MNLSNRDIALGQSMFVSSATQQHQLGARGVTPDGRVYRYAKAGAVALVAGNVLQSPAIQGGNLALAANTTTPASVGSSAVNFTAASSVGANVYAEGYLAIASGAGQGLLYTINNQAAVSTGTTGVFNLYAPEDTLVVAMTSTSTVSILQNKYNGVVVAPITTATGVIVGVSTYVIAVTQYGWIQTWGITANVVEGTPALGAPVYGITISSAGAVAAITAAALLTNQFVGYMAQAGVAAQYCFVDLRISP